MGVCVRARKGFSAPCDYVGVMRVCTLFKLDRQELFNNIDFEAKLGAGGFDGSILVHLLERTVEPRFEVDGIVDCSYVEFSGGLRIKKQEDERVARTPILHKL